MRPDRKAFALCVAFATVALWTPTAGAQNTPDPADPAARVPAARYSSTFAGYRRMAEEPVANWRESNEAAAKAGGWKAYAREAQAPDDRPAVPSPSAAPAKPAEGGHGMHHEHAMPGGAK